MFTFTNVGQSGTKICNSAACKLPFYMPEQFFSGHNPMKGLAQLLKSCDHYVVEFLYAQVRPEHRPLNPYLHQQRGLNTNAKIVHTHNQKLSHINNE